MQKVWRDHIPPYGAGQRIGLLGGSFNPPHQGHVLVSEMLMKRLGLDWVWWLVTPGNPLKDISELPSLEKRLELAAQINTHPKVRITGIEARLGTRFTADTLKKLKMRAPNARFIWLMGGDNLGQFHKWEDWKKIAFSTPMAIYDRPGYRARAMHSPAGLALGRNRINEQDAELLGAQDTRGHAPWVYLTGPLSNLSSTELRKNMVKKD